jgi:hypothetical protein
MAGLGLKVVPRPSDVLIDRFEAWYVLGLLALFLVLTTRCRKRITKNLIASVDPH